MILACKGSRKVVDNIPHSLKIIFFWILCKTGDVKKAQDVSNYPVRSLALPHWQLDLFAWSNSLTWPPFLVSVLSFIWAPVSCGEAECEQAAGLQETSASLSPLLNGHHLTGNSQLDLEMTRFSQNKKYLNEYHAKDFFVVLPSAKCSTLLVYSIYMYRERWVSFLLLYFQFLLWVIAN